MRTAFVCEDAHTRTKARNVSGALSGQGGGAGLGLAHSMALDLRRLADTVLSYPGVAISTLCRIYW